MKPSPCPMTRRPAAPPPGPPTPIVEEPVMKRYCNPLPCWGAYPVPVPSPDGLDRVLEELTRQNQLLWLPSASGAVWWERTDLSKKIHRRGNFFGRSAV